MRFAKDLWREIQEDDISGLAAELAYRFLFALFPLMIFATELVSFGARWLGIERPSDRLIAEMDRILPAAASAALAEPLRNVIDNNHGGLLSFGILTAIWAGSGGMKAFIKATNRAYDVEETRPFWKHNLVAVGLTVLAGIAFIGSFVVLVAGQFVGIQIAGALGFEQLGAQVVTLARIPAIVLLLMAATAFLYWAAPAARVPWRWVSMGGVVFVLTWLAVTFAFAFYVQNFGSYEATYGALGGVIVLMLWLYLTSFVLLLGAEINALAERAVEPEEYRDRAPESAKDATAPDARGGARTPAPAPAPARPVLAEAAAVARRRPLTALLGAAVGAVLAARLAK